MFSYGSEKNIPLFYTDMVGIGAGIGEDKKELAFELANILISEEVLTGMSAPSKDGDPPQYLLTPRKNVYDALCKECPIYGVLRDIVDSDENHVFRMGADVRLFITDSRLMIQTVIAQKYIAFSYMPENNNQNSLKKPSPQPFENTGIAGIALHDS